MKLTWLGHACFKMEHGDGTSIITDPFDSSVGYTVPKESGDIVTCSHDHFDHNYTDAVQGNPAVIDEPGDFNLKGIRIKGISSFHDDANGAKRGKNIIYVYSIDGLKVCHLGDLGHALTREHVAQIGKIDVLLIPVGGTFTIDASGAMRTIDMLNPAVTIPMHYKTPVLSFSLDTVDKFLSLAGEYQEVDNNSIEITKNNMGKLSRVLVLSYE